MKSLILFLLISFSATSFAQSLNEVSKGNKFNPAIGINILTLTQKSERETKENGMGLQGVELQFSSDVDAYFRAEATIGIHKAHHHEEEGEEEEEEAHGYVVEPEEAFFETTSTKGYTLKFGKFFADFGKYNALHTHALPFIDRGVVQSAMFGEEALSEVGAEVSFLIPASWFSEVKLQALQATSEHLFAESNDSTAYVLKAKNLWDLSDALTIEWGLSGLSYHKHAYGGRDEERTTLSGIDLTLKWRPTVGGKSKSAMWSTEYIHMNKSGSTDMENGGIATFVRYQFADRWYSQLRYEFLGLEKTDGIEDVKSYTALVAYAPTEFSAVRLQYDIINDAEEEDEKRLSLQFNISIGAHPAHQY